MHYVVSLQVNGEAIYNTTPYKVQFDTSKKHTWFTSPKVSYC